MIDRSVTISFPLGVARVLSLADAQNVKEWKTAFAGKCKDHRFYEIVEQTLDSQFEHSYLLLEDQAGRVRAIQPLFFVQQNLVEGIPAFRGVVNAIRRRFPRFLTMRVLMVGNAAGEGHLSACAPEDEDWVANALLATLKTYARQSKASLVVFKDFAARYRHALRNFSANGYTRVPSMPMTELQLRYTDFDHYLSTLGASTRKDLRRKFRKTAAAPPISLEVVTDLTPFVDEVYPLYLQVHERSPLKFECLTKEYLCSLGQRKQSSRQNRPERVERAEIDLRGRFQIPGRQFRVIHFRGETLFAPRIDRRRKRAADIAAHDLRARRAQLRQRPGDIFHREPAVLPVGDRVLRSKTIEIDRDVKIRSSQRARELRETFAPLRREDRSRSSLSGGRPAIRPTINLQPSLPFRAPIAEESPRPPALEVPAAPHAHFFTCGSSSARFTQPPQHQRGGRTSQSG